jgi:hypothetical protein
VSGSDVVGVYLVVLMFVLEVGEGVVVAAEETEVGDDGFSSFCPGDDVVDVELPPVRWTPWFVRRCWGLRSPVLRRPGGGGGDDPGFASDVDDF